MKKIYLISGVAFIVFMAFVLHFFKSPEVRESITFFPIDPNVTYKTAQTSLQLTKRPNTIQWKVQSELDRKAYLRQDAGLLFSNGRLIGILRDWKQNTALLTQEKQLTIDKSALYQAITFHHSEIHQKNEQIFSSQTMSADNLYILYSNSKVTDSFRTAVTAAQNQLKSELDSKTERMLQLSWNKGVRQYSINLKNYQAFPLNEFNEKAKDALPGFTKTETAKIVGNLWEGLYKNYLLGIKNADGTIETPVGSTLPLILLAKDKTHLLVLTETSKGNPILLRQMIE